jgi:hypothetical protein
MIRLHKNEKKPLGCSGAHEREEREATFAVGPMNNMEVRKLLRGRRCTGAIRKELCMYVGIEGCVGTWHSCAQDGKPGSVRCAQKMTKVTVM